jgi:serine/threonine protein kinase
MRYFINFRGIPQFHACFSQDENIYFIMEYVEGGSFANFLKKYQKDFTFPII